MARSSQAAIAPVEHIARSILVLRGHKVLLDAELAALYGLTTGAIIQAVKRNIGRFPPDFMFQLTAAICPTSSPSRGVAMLSSVLSSERTIAVNIGVMRAFVRMRELRASNAELAHRVDELEARIEKKLATHDEAIAAILSAIRQLMNSPAPMRRPVGFTADLSKKR